MKEKSKRLDVSGPASSLTSNPFAQLSGTPPEKLSENPVPVPPVKPHEVKVQVRFRIERTRKGGYPIFVEKRAAGKTVTIIRSVFGDTDALLSLLKKRCAAGGKAFTDSVEIQGDHRSKVEALLREQGL